MITYFQFKHNKQILYVQIVHYTVYYVHVRHIVRVHLVYTVFVTNQSSTLMYHVFVYN